MFLNLVDSNRFGASWAAIRQINTFLIALLSSVVTFFSIALVMWVATVVAL
jgi:hypothetical protein